MRKTMAAALSLAVCAGAAPASLAAQDAPARDGLWGSIGGGVGFNLTESSEGERLTGVSAFARGGWGLTPQWLIGGDLIGWFRSRDEADLTRGFAGGTVLFYPSAGSGFFFKGGIGGAFSRVSAGVASDGTTWGFGSTLGLGYDIRLGRTLALALAADWLFQDVSIDTRSNNQLGMLTVGLTFF